MARRDQLTGLVPTSWLPSYSLSSNRRGCLAEILLLNSGFLSERGCIGVLRTSEKPSVFVHFGLEHTEDWLLVRLENPDEDELEGQPSASSPTN